MAENAHREGYAVSASLLQETSRVPEGEHFPTVSVSAAALVAACG